MSWPPRQRLNLVVEDHVLRLSDPLDPSTTEPAGVAIALDERFRVVLPYGMRVTAGFQSSQRLIVLTIRHQGIVAALPVAQLVEALIGAR